MIFQFYPITILVNNKIIVFSRNQLVGISRVLANKETQF